MCVCVCGMCMVCGVCVWCVWRVCVHAYMYVCICMCGYWLVSDIYIVIYIISGDGLSSTNSQPGGGSHAK